MLSAYTTPSTRLSLVGLLLSIARLCLTWYNKVNKLEDTINISSLGRQIVTRVLQRLLFKKQQKDCSYKGYRRPFI